MKLTIPKEIEDRIHGYVMSVPTEIAGMGRVTVSPDGDQITVDEVMIYEQDVTGATADLSPQALAKFQTDLVRAGGSPKNWRLWFHSHANMEAFFSARDVATIDGQTEGDWMISLVVNKRREREARLDLYRPFRMYMDKLDIQIGTEAEVAYQVPADIVEEVARKVKRPAPITAPIGFHFDKKGAIDLHRYCPMHNTGEKKCYFPYGKMHAIYADCTTKAFKKAYGANPFMPTVPESIEGEYSRDELLAVTKTLEGQITELENKGRGDSAEYLELSRELADWYYELAEAENDPHVSEAILTEAQQLENVIYQMDSLANF